MSDKMTYNMALARLEEIMAHIQSGNMDVEKLTHELSEAQELIKFCRNRIYKIDEEVKAMIANEE
ncbi:MAG: exodeoxyribonuclease VII small subunit [Bacteroidaceae bacterium]|nr:exodeoxyribonuclease VII small subunit [Bacteroidaceae bacterium]